MINRLFVFLYIISVILFQTIKIDAQELPILDIKPEGCINLVEGLPVDMEAYRTKKLTGPEVQAILVAWQYHKNSQGLFDRDMRKFIYNICSKSDVIEIFIATKIPNTAPIQIERSGIYGYVFDSNNFSMISSTLY